MKIKLARHYGTVIHEGAIPDPDDVPDAPDVITFGARVFMHDEGGGE